MFCQDRSHNGSLHGKGRQNGAELNDSVGSILQCSVSHTAKENVLMEIVGEAKTRRIPPLFAVSQVIDDEDIVHSLAVGLPYKGASNKKPAPPVTITFLMT